MSCCLPVALKQTNKTLLPGKEAVKRVARHEKVMWNYMMPCQYGLEFLASCCFHVTNNEEIFNLLLARRN